MTQKEWITSRESSWIVIFLFSGRYRVGILPSWTEPGVALVVVRLGLDARVVDVVGRRS